MADKNISQTLIRISKEYVEDELSKKLKGIWDKTSIFVYGSSSYGLADEFSNTNLEVIYPERKLGETSSYFVQREEKQIKVDFSPWPKYEKYLKDLPKNSETIFWVIQKAIILHDPTHKFKKIQDQINKYLPDDIWKAKVFTKWFEVAFNGTQKAMKRNEAVVATICKAKMVQNIMELTFLLNRQYLPPLKWLYRKFLDLPLLSQETEPLLMKILNSEKLEDFALQEKKIWNIFNHFLKINNILPHEKIDKPWMFV